MLIQNRKSKRWIWTWVCWGCLSIPVLWAQKNPEPVASLVSAQEKKGSLQPPFQEELLLDQKKDPATQVRILQKDLEENPRDPQNPQRLLTIAFLSDEFLADPSQAAAAYEGYSNQARSSRFALHARFRAAELLYQQSQKGASAQERAYLLGQVAKLENIISQTTQPRRSLTGAAAPSPLRVWEKDRQGRWSEITAKEIHGRALKRIDEVSRGKWSYQVLDLLFRAMGGRPGLSHALALLWLAFLLKLILHPLNRKQYASMAKMQEIQPHIKKIQEKFKDNPQRLRTEMMKVYREYGVNPMAGCFPLLIQLPVIFSVYGGIQAYSYQFSQAPPILGINLGQPNLFLLVLYSVSMFLQQKLMMMRSPQVPMDPQQEQMQKMMQFMPLIFTVMMWMYGWPSAFYLYWLAFNVLSTAEQWFIISKLKGPVGPGTRPLAGSEGGRDNGDRVSEIKPLSPEPEEKEEKPSRPRPRSRQRPLSVVPSPGSKESRKRRVTRRR